MRGFSVFCSVDASGKLVSQFKSLVLTIACYVDPNLGCSVQSALALINIYGIHFRVMHLLVLSFPFYNAT